MAAAEGIAVDVDAGVDTGINSGFARIASADVRALWEALARVNPAIGRQVAAIVTAKLDRHIAGLLVSTAPTLREGLRRFLEHERHFHGKDAVQAANEPRGQRFEYGPGLLGRQMPTTLGHAAAIEFLFAAVANAARATTGRDRPIAWVQLRHLPLGEPNEYETAFGVRPTFSASRDALLIDNEVLDAPQVTRNSAVQALAARHLRELAVPNIARDDYDRLSESVARLLAEGTAPSLAQVAADLRMSRRTIQRRLRARGGSFRQLVESVRIALARSYLLDPSLSIGQVALLLGYADHSAFARAYRRATGAPPTAHRR